MVQPEIESHRRKVCKAFSRSRRGRRRDLGGPNERESVVLREGPRYKQSRYISVPARRSLSKHAARMEAGTDGRTGGARQRPPELGLDRGGSPQHRVLGRLSTFFLSHV